ncbi:MAG: hypothetical protein F4110_01900 [Acidimicrobiaceae bacterium]|nr:hypothetical protein [Acidimicrobiaceae bacterium]MYE75544.1 hypothetical protein [Acidimicrobiaceae bacterium]MYI52738.1 hypothetical protein [Acidimicrobiaceae bacterium]MYJ42822.1 hypothetical protein [Acidimicrobiaceae bacterium]
MTNFDQLTITGSAHNLWVHLGEHETTLVAGERHMALAPTRSMDGVRCPDLLVAFGVASLESERARADAAEARVRELEERLQDLAP